MQLLFWSTIHAALFSGYAMHMDFCLCHKFVCQRNDTGFFCLLTIFTTICGVYTRTLYWYMRRRRRGVSEASEAECLSFNLSNVLYMAIFFALFVAEHALRAYINFSEPRSYGMSAWTRATYIADNSVQLCSEEHVLFWNQRRYLHK